MTYDFVYFPTDDFNKGKSTTYTQGGPGIHGKVNALTCIALFTRNYSLMKIYHQLAMQAKIHCRMKEDNKNHIS